MLVRQPGARTARPPTSAKRGIASVVNVKFSGISLFSRPRSKAKRGRGLVPRSRLNDK